MVFKTIALTLSLVVLCVRGRVDRAYEMNESDKASIYGGQGGPTPQLEDSRCLPDPQICQTDNTGCNYAPNTLLCIPEVRVAGDTPANNNFCQSSYPGWVCSSSAGLPVGTACVIILECKRNELDECVNISQSWISGVCSEQSNPGGPGGPS
jgi:hypothetical protein